MVYVLAVVTLLVGAVLAVVQTNVKRMLAYSSISHAGFILVAVAGRHRTRASARRSSTWPPTRSWWPAASASSPWSAAPATTHHDLADYQGLAKRPPLLAFAFPVFLLAQAGVPFTSGFLAKFYVIGAAVEARSYWLALIAMLSSVISAFVYLRIVLTMYDRDAEASGPEAPPSRPGARVAPSSSPSWSPSASDLVPEPLAHVTKTAVALTQPRPAPAAAPIEISAGG